MEAEPDGVEVGFGADFGDFGDAEALFFDFALVVDFGDGADFEDRRFWLGSGGHGQGGGGDGGGGLSRWHTAGLVSYANFANDRALVAGWKWVDKRDGLRMVVG